MEKYQLNAVTRDTGAQPAKLRKEGYLPAELYGHKVENQHIAVKGNEFERIWKRAGESTLVEIITDNGKTHNVLIHGVQRHVVTHQPIHVDLLEVSMTEKLQAQVALEFTGESSAVKLLGGTLVKVLDEVQVESLPANLPHNIEIDISVLKSFEDQILVKDLKVGANVEILTPGDEVVATVQPPRDVEAELAEPVAEIDVSTIEGIAEKTDEPEAGAEEEKK